MTKQLTEAEQGQLTRLAQYQSTVKMSVKDFAARAVTEDNVRIRVDAKAFGINPNGVAALLTKRFRYEFIYDPTQDEIATKENFNVHIAASLLQQIEAAGFATHWYLINMLIAFDEKDAKRLAINPADSNAAAANAERTGPVGPAGARPAVGGARAVDVRDGGAGTDEMIIPPDVTQNVRRGRPPGNGGERGGSGGAAR